MSEFNAITGYWKDDKSDFEGYIIAAYDNSLDGEVMLTDSEIILTDDDIFYYGMGTQSIEEAIQLGENTSLEFVITEYTEL